MLRVFTHGEIEIQRDGDLNQGKWRMYYVLYGKNEGD